MLFFDGLELRVLHEYLEAGLDDLEEACAQSGFFVLKGNDILISKAKLRLSEILKVLGNPGRSWEILKGSRRA